MKAYTCVLSQPKSHFVAGPTFIDLHLALQVEQQVSTLSILRMITQAETTRYNLFPKEKQAVTLQRKGLDPEQAFVFAMAQSCGDKADKPHMGSLRVRIREHNLIRRRKVSVPELGPMTTVHESRMDSRK